MEKLRKAYCRFCAERKRPEKLVDLERDLTKMDETVLKLGYLKDSPVDLSNDNSLPKTVCLVCWESLNKAFEFFNKLAQAQTILAELYYKNNSPTYDYPDDDDTEYGDLYPDTRIEDSNILMKNQSLQEPENPCNLLSAVPDVKVELKEESLDRPPSQSDVCYDQSLSVQALLDAAMGELLTEKDLTLFAKEVPLVHKKGIKHWKDYQWCCWDCNNEFPTMEVLRIHSKEAHNICASFTCIDCKDYTNCNFESFVGHVRKHRKTLRNLCHYCDKKTDNLPKHLQSHLKKPKKACPVCGDIFSNDESLQKHVKEFTSKKVRTPRRKRGTPITTEDLTCKTCSKVYKNLNSLRDHQKLHTSERKRNYTCDRCGKTFFNKGTLTTHIMSHDKIRPHLCKICNKTFLFPNMLRRHVEMHSNIKPFSCEQCGRCFRLQYQLNSHKIIHTDSLPYVCQYCSKAFRFKQILKNHERMHTGSKPYSCGICLMEFTNWSNYNKHMKRRHNTDTSKKKITPEGVFPVNPVTGQVMMIQDPVGTEEWKNEIMIPGKRGKKKKIKEEVVNSVTDEMYVLPCSFTDVRKPQK